ncbi:hypothetical protein DSO57_1029113 [Entomophthora muscae]|uniref:Uncharacterized protein n=1 Tax=Entomophthora muscae TaxID=34485 RepID=A0ACC2SDW1_9FUNG|nr:hypothetical protein DSO57_1029113 [Entomophthora muscae]
MSPFSEKIPKAFGVKCEPIYAADFLATDQQKALAIYLFVAVCCTWSYPIFKGYHLRVYMDCLLTGCFLIWKYICHLIDFGDLYLYFSPIDLIGGGAVRRWAADICYLVRLAPAMHLAEDPLARTWGVMKSDGLALD